MNQEVVIIGGVAAGMSCAAKLSREDSEARITVYEKGKHISYGACGLPYYIGDVIEDHNRLVIKEPEDFEGSNIDVRIKHQVVKVLPDKKKVVVENLETGEEFEKNYHKLVIATGAEPVKPPFVDENVGNVFTLRTVEDGQRIKEAALSDKVERVVLIGAGYIGLELVESFHNLGKDISVINRSANIMKPVDQEIREILMEELKGKEIRLNFNEEVEKITQGGDGMVKSVITDKGEHQADLVVVAIGVVPATRFLDGTGIETLKNGAIVINDRMETNISDIYAAGDCATLYHRILKKNVHIPLATYANRQGRLLGEILSGKDSRFPGGIGASVVKIMDMTISAAGINEKQAKDEEFDYGTEFIKGYSNAGYYPGSKPLYVKYIFDKNSKILLGAQLAGEKGAQHRIDALSIAIQNGMTLRELAYSDFAYTPPYSGAWDPLQVAANVAE
ncbi:CoA-disulfide reductase [Gudongella sp. SC589]|jgi:NADPH-dependent 2,4-dienoyl-CoA reductase/sulfur reductase-like enzyme|uniref:CoA-disulfide reductase n=1 Tax=Gudongella sp. SC589 TaxID=3385990 RepID=UPI003904D6EC